MSQRIFVNPTSLPDITIIICVHPKRRYSVIVTHKWLLSQDKIHPSSQEHAVIKRYGCQVGWINVT